MQFHFFNAGLHSLYCFMTAIETQNQTAGHNPLGAHKINLKGLGEQ